MKKMMVGCLWCHTWFDELAQSTYEERPYIAFREYFICKNCAKKVTVEKFMELVVKESRAAKILEKE